MAKRDGAVHVAILKREYKGKVYNSAFLRRNYREGTKVRYEMLGNISHLPAELIDLLCRALKGEPVGPLRQAFTVVRSLCHGHVAAALDGLYVVRTSVPKEAMTAEETVGAYKSLAHVERAFRSLKTVDIEIRPIYHRLSDRVKAHVFLCKLAY